MRHVTLGSTLYMHAQIYKPGTLRAGQASKWSGERWTFRSAKKAIIMAPQVVFDQETLRSHASEVSAMHRRSRRLSAHAGALSVAQRTLNTTTADSHGADARDASLERRRGPGSAGRRAGCCRAVGMSDFVVALQCVRSVRCDAGLRGQLRRAGCVTVALRFEATGPGRGWGATGCDLSDWNGVNYCTAVRTGERVGHLLELLGG